MQIPRRNVQVAVLVSGTLVILAQSLAERMGATSIDSPRFWAFVTILAIVDFMATWLIIDWLDKE